MELNKRFYKKYSLSTKITALIVCTACVLGLLAIAINYRIYCNELEDLSERQCNSMISFVERKLQPNELNSFLQNGIQTDRYLSLKSELETLLSSFSDITYLYVYKIDEEGCHVIFDCDTPELQGESLGTVIDYDPAFEQYMDDLLQGKDIPPVISNDLYGWLLTVYRGVYDRSGQCVAYIGVDVSMEELRSERYIFIIRIISLLTGATILITAFSIWFAQRRIVSPINALSVAAGSFAYDTELERKKTAERMQQLHFQTGDEIENLYSSVTKMMTDVVHYIEQLDVQSRDIAEQASVIEEMQDNIILTFANLIESRDGKTGDHVRHTATYVRVIGGELLKEGLYPDVLGQQYLTDMVKAAPMHDVGKICVSDAILNKPGRLTPEEFSIIKQHTIVGRDILQDSFRRIESRNYLVRAMEMAAWHHEKWDGSGYPDGLRGEDIPLCARVMAVADVFDALISRRSYKEPYSFEKAVAIIRENRGTHFDPAVVDAFLASLDEIRKVREA